MSLAPRAYSKKEDHSLGLNLATAELLHAQTSAEANEVSAAARCRLLGDVHGVTRAKQPAWAGGLEFAVNRLLSFTLSQGSLLSIPDRL